MEQICISFTPEEGACRRLLGLIECKGGRITALDMAEAAEGALSRLRVTYAGSGCEQRNRALVQRIRNVYGVVDASVTTAAR